MFFLENEGTMLDIHRKAILTALGLDAETDPSHLRFDPKGTYGIKRNRFFFRNFIDMSAVAKRDAVPLQESLGPVLDCDDHPIPFGPLLRICATIDHGVQPIPLVWDYQHWRGRKSFREQIKMQKADSVPSLNFDRALSPNLLKAWTTFLQSTGQRNLQLRP